ncbi:MAG: hypothetical protein ACREAA_18300 [Candidatus Polarisedimenticolia bacterium]
MRAAAPAILLAMTCLGAACQGTGGKPPDDPAALRTLDESTASALRRDFDGASDRGRYVVALSPT